MNKSLFKIILLLIISNLNVVLSQDNHIVKLFASRNLLRFNGHQQWQPPQPPQPPQGYQQTHQQPPVPPQQPPGPYQQPPGPHQQPPGPHQQPPGPHQQQPRSHVQPPGPHQQPPGPHQHPPGWHVQPPGPHQQPPGPHVQPPGPNQQPPGPHQQPPGPHVQPPGPHVQPPGPQQQLPGPPQQPPGPHQQPPGPPQKPPGPPQPQHQPAPWTVDLGDASSGNPTWTRYDDLVQQLLTDADEHPGTVKEVCFLPDGSKNGKLYKIDLIVGRALWTDEKFPFWKKDLSQTEPILEIINFIQTQVDDPSKQRPVRQITYSNGYISWEWWNGHNANSSDKWLLDPAGKWEPIIPDKSTVAYKQAPNWIAEKLTEVLDSPFSHTCFPQYIGDTNNLDYVNVELKPNVLGWGKDSWGWKKQPIKQDYCGNGYQQYYQWRPQDIYKQRIICRYPYAAAKQIVDATGETTVKIECSQHDNKDCYVYIKGACNSQGCNIDEQKVLNKLKEDFNILKPNFMLPPLYQHEYPKYFWHGTSSKNNYISPLTYSFTDQSPALWTVVLGTYSQDLGWAHMYSSLSSYVPRIRDIIGYIAVFEVDEKSCYDAPKYSWERIKIDNSFGVTFPHLTSTQIHARTHYKATTRYEGFKNGYPGHRGQKNELPDAYIFPPRAAQQCKVKAVRSYTFRNDPDGKFQNGGQITQAHLQKMRADHASGGRYVGHAAPSEIDRGQ